MDCNVRDLSLIEDHCCMSLPICFFLHHLSCWLIKCPKIIHTQLHWWVWLGVVRCVLCCPCNHTDSDVLKYTCTSQQTTRIWLCITNRWEYSYCVDRLFIYSNQHKTKEQRGISLQTFLWVNVYLSGNNVLVALDN